jgi:hypothetical protein
MDKIVVQLPNGNQLVAQASSDPSYPGIYITLEGENVDKTAVSIPTVLMESLPEGELRVIVWGKKDSEDYTHKVVFEA